MSVELMAAKRSVICVSIGQAIVPLSLASVAVEVTFIYLVTIRACPHTLATHLPTHEVASVGATVHPRLTALARHLPIREVAFVRVSACQPELPPGSVLLAIHPAHTHAHIHTQ
jgi:uncharacterized membrane protein